MKPSRNINSYQRLFLLSTLRCIMKNYVVFILYMNSFRTSSIFLNVKDVNSFLCTIIFISHGNKRIETKTVRILSFLFMLSPLSYCYKKRSYKSKHCIQFCWRISLGVVLFVASDNSNHWTFYFQPFDGFFSWKRMGSIFRPFIVWSTFFIAKISNFKSRSISLFECL